MSLAFQSRRSVFTWPLIAWFFPSSCQRPCGILIADNNLPVSNDDERLTQMLTNRTPRSVCRRAIDDAHLIHAGDPVVVSTIERMRETKYAINDLESLFSFQRRSRKKRDPQGPDFSLSAAAAAHKESFYYISLCCRIISCLDQQIEKSVIGCR